MCPTFLLFTALDRGDPCGICRKALQILVAESLSDLTVRFRDYKFRRFHRAAGCEERADREGQAPLIVIAKTGYLHSIFADAV